MKSSSMKAVCRLATCALAAALALSFQSAVLARSADAPAALQMGASSPGELRKDESHYFRAALPAGNYKVIYDARRADGTSGNIMTRVSLLDADGAVVTRSLARMNEIDVSWRAGGVFTLKKAATIGLRLANEHDPIEFWLSLLPADSKTLVPFFGATTPAPIALGQSQSGTLKRGESAYYQISLPKGDYKAVFEMTNADGKDTNLIGYVAALQNDGTTQKKIARMNEIDVTHRMSSPLVITEEGTTILRVANVGGTGKPDQFRSHYSVKIVAE